MIRALRAELDLTQALVCADCCLADRLGKELRIHEMRAGTGTKISAVLHKLQAAHVNLAVALDGLLNGVTRLCKGWGIKDHHVILFSLCLQLWQKRIC